MTKEPRETIILREAVTTTELQRLVAAHFADMVTFELIGCGNES